MQLSKFTDYALRVLMHLAVADDNLLTTRQIAEIHGARFNHLAKVTQWLVREGYVTSLRGRTGGLRLAKKPIDISLGRIVRALERPHDLVECMQADGGTCILASACGLTATLGEAQEAFFNVLDRKTLAQVSTSETQISILLRGLNAQ